MSSWAGFRSPEFGVYPVELQFWLDSHVGPSWVLPALINRSGWLSVAEVEMETEFDRTRAVIAACINDEGAVLGQWVVEALFSMQSSLPKEVTIEPPEELEDALDALYWDFLGRCDIDHLKALEEEERRISEAIVRLERRRRDVYEQVEVFLSSLYARRRRERGNDELCKMLDSKIKEVETKQAEAEIWYRDRLLELQTELANFETLVLASLQNHGSMRPLYTVYWQTHHSKVRTVAYAGFEMRFGLPAPQTLNASPSPTHINVTEERKRRIDQKRKEFDYYYESLKERMKIHAALDNSVRKIADSLNTPSSPAQKLRTKSPGMLPDPGVLSANLELGKRAEIVSMSRRWQVLHRSVDGVTKESAKTKVSKPQTASKTGALVIEKEMEPDLPGALFNCTDSGSSPAKQDDTTSFELHAATIERKLVDEDLLLQELQSALDKDATNSL